MLQHNSDSRLPDSMAASLRPASGKAGGGGGAGGSTLGGKRSTIYVLATAMVSGGTYINRVRVCKRRTARVPWL